MAFITRKLQETDYDEFLVKWWNDWGWSAPSRDFLPENGCGGLIVYKDETPICAGFIYYSNSKVSWVDWIISNRQYKEKPYRKEGLDLLIEKLTTTATDNGVGYIYGLIQHKGLIEVYKKFGYTEGSTYKTEMIKII